MADLPHSWNNERIAATNIAALSMHAAGDDSIRHPLPEAGTRIGEFLARIVRDNEVEHRGSKISPMVVMTAIRSLLQAFAQGVDFRQLFQADKQCLSFTDIPGGQPCDNEDHFDLVQRTDPY